MSSQGDLRAALLTAASETHVDLDSEITPLFISLTSGLLMDLLTQINAANGTRHYVRPADSYADWYAYTTKNRQYNIGTDPVAALDASELTDYHVVAVSGWRVTADVVTNQQIATVDEPEFPTLGIVKVWEYNALPGLPLTVLAATPFTITVTYADYVASCPTLVIVSSGDTLYQQFAHHGYSSDITLTSAGTTSVTVFAVYGDQAVRDPAQTHTANDLASQPLPRGIRAGPEINGDLVGAFASAIGISEHMVWRYGEPLKRPSVTIENWFGGLAFDLYDVVSFTSAQLKVSTLAFEIVGLSETFSRAADNGAVFWSTTYQWQQRVDHVAFFTLDVDDLDNTTQLLAY